MERRTGNKSHLAFNGDPQDLSGVHAFRHDTPQEHAALRMSPMHFRREHFLHHFHHHIPPLHISGADQIDMFIQEAALADLVGHVLVEGGRVQVRRLFGHNQFLNDRFRSNHPSQPQARCQ